MGKMKREQEKVMKEVNNRSGEGAEVSYRKMSAAFEKVKPEMYTETEYADICRRYAYATIQMVKLRSFVRGPKV